ncbi:hypothetical protein SAMN05660860_01856 [Geoalkalibacter ferrihydriticus]|uniref:UPF0178 protein SAMN05660860_01856 n=1 Tax=Geoalkalibacter ferrihydriticus TaxID=392333 RepID=A0A1G9QQ87_9BACT|nr:YaiI/YqxD family protein [Geoalkalibacter ferrihydriticus]SDM12727.1 hypothetical protein SAMN05660860_01856 [Geoalkalibacter ferrihydriticus]
MLREMNVTIWIDADACPRAVKDIVFRAAERLQLKVCLVANKGLAKHHTHLISSVVVPGDPDEADKYIAQHATACDLVITADIPLAAKVVAKGTVAIDPRGTLYTGDNVGERLSSRDLMQSLRDEGMVQGGPGPFGSADRQRFASALDRTLTRMLRE